MVEPGTQQRRMERNLALYPAYLMFRGALFWVPVFFLYFASVLPIDQVLLLEAIYYLGVVVLEVPSGYFSDRLGRRTTLIISALTTTSACALFAATASMEWFAVAQLLLAAGMAFNSGTDSALLYDSLAALDRGDELGDHEGRANARRFIALAVSAVVGGAAAGVDLRIAYVLSAAGGLGALVVALRFHEPAVRERAAPPLRQLGDVLSRMRDPILRWTFAFGVCMTVLVHIPYEFFQPYVGFLLGAETSAYAKTPLITGALLAASMLVSAWASARSMALQRKLGAAGLLLTAFTFEVAIVVAMAQWLHPAVLVPILLRSVAVAAAKPVINAAIHPRLTAGIRATYLSVQSLAGRLGFSATLAAISSAFASDTSSWSEIASVLWVCSAAAAAVLVALAALTPRGLRST